jgi:hypothetical protein
MITMISIFSEAKQLIKSGEQISTSFICGKVQCRKCMDSDRLAISPFHINNIPFKNVAMKIQII